LTSEREASRRDDTPNKSFSSSAYPSYPPLPSLPSVSTAAITATSAIMECAEVASSMPGHSSPYAPAKVWAEFRRSGAKVVEVFDLNSRTSEADEQLQNPVRACPPSLAEVGDTVWPSAIALCR